MHFLSDGFRLAFDDEGDGRPALLLHDFASNRRLNWTSTGWIESLDHAGYRVIAPDLRGHGESDKPQEPVAYLPSALARDVIGLMDYLAVERVEIIGYGMGARIALEILIRQPDRLRHAVIAGLGDEFLANLDVETVAGNFQSQVASEAFAFELVPERLARMLKKEDKPSPEAMMAQELRAIAEQNGCDLRAMSAFIRGYGEESLDERAISNSDVPLLFIAGGADEFIGDAQRLASVNSKAEFTSIPERTHANLMNDRRFKDAVMAFLAEGA